jgi:hypothetical protein
MAAFAASSQPDDEVLVFVPVPSDTKGWWFLNETRAFLPTP